MLEGPGADAHEPGAAHHQPHQPHQPPLTTLVALAQHTAATGAALLASGDLAIGLAGLTHAMFIIADVFEAGGVPPPPAVHGTLQETLAAVDAALGALPEDVGQQQVAAAAALRQQCQNGLALLQGQGQGPGDGGDDEGASDDLSDVSASSGVDSDDDGGAHVQPPPTQQRLTLDLTVRAGCARARLASRMHSGADRA